MFAAAVGLVLSIPPVSAEINFPRQSDLLVIGASSAFLLGAGLALTARWRPASEVTLAAGANVGLGFAAALLAGWQIAPVVARQQSIRRLAEGLSLDGPALLGLAGMASVVFFAMVRADKTSRSDTEMSSKPPAVGGENRRHGQSDR